MTEPDAYVTEMLDEVARLNAANAAQEDARRAARELEVRVAASLYAVLWSAHSTHGNTAGPRGGIGGQAITAHCHILDPYPSSMNWTQMDLPSEFLREWITAHPDVDIAAEATMLTSRWLEQLNGGTNERPRH